MRFYFEEAAQWEAHVKDTLEEINRLGLPLVLFGRSKTTDTSFFKQLRVPVQYICCNNTAAWGGKFWGLDVISPDQMQEIYRNRKYALLNLVAEKRTEIRQQLQSLPNPPAALFRLDLHRTMWDQHLPPDSAAYFRQRQGDATAIYDRLADQMSKDTYEAVIRYRMSRDADVLAAIAQPVEKQYFPRSLGGGDFLGADECFVDAGAYTGDTVRRFVSVTGGNYRRIYSIEPERKNYEALRKNVETINHVICLKYGLGESKQTLRISSAGTGSKIVTDENAECIPVDTLDHLLSGAPVTYIKMDIEGMECPALRGAKELIQKYRPKLAICCYHSDADLIGVPGEILRLCSDYRLFLRQYTYNLAETVCYAVCP